MFVDSTPKKASPQRGDMCRSAPRPDNDVKCPNQQDIQPLSGLVVARSILL